MHYNFFGLLYKWRVWINTFFYIGHRFTKEFVHFFCIFVYDIWQLPFLWEEWGAPLVAGLEGFEEGRLASSLNGSVPWELVTELAAKGVFWDPSSCRPWNVATVASELVFDWDEVDFRSWLVSRNRRRSFHFDLERRLAESCSDWGQLRFCTTKSMSSGSASSVKVREKVNK